MREAAPNRPALFPQTAKAMCVWLKTMGSIRFLSDCNRYGRMWAPFAIMPPPSTKSGGLSTLAIFEIPPASASAYFFTAFSASGLPFSNREKKARPSSEFFAKCFSFSAERRRALADAHS